MDRESTAASRCGPHIGRRRCLPLDTSKPPKMASFAASVANAAVFRPAVVRR